MTKIYVASSWRNEYYHRITEILQDHGFYICDWREKDSAFQWRQIDPDWREWSPKKYLEVLDSNLASKGFQNDLELMEEADICVLLLPCGKSAHLEAGWFIGKGKPTFILLEDSVFVEPELMYKLANKICLSVRELINDITKYLHRR